MGQTLPQRIHGFLDAWTGNSHIKALGLSCTGLGGHCKVLEDGLGLGEDCAGRDEVALLKGWRAEAGAWNLRMAGTGLRASKTEHWQLPPLCSLLSHPEVPSSSKPGLVGAVVVVWGRCPASSLPPLGGGGT